MTEGAISLARVNAPVASLCPHRNGISHFYVAENSLNGLALSNPATYLTLLSQWRKMLYNQIYYTADEETVKVACSDFDESEGQIRIIEFVGQFDEDGDIRIDSVRNAGYGHWKPIKSETRRLNRNGKKAKQPND